MVQLGSPSARLLIAAVTLEGVRTAKYVFPLREIIDCRETQADGSDPCGPAVPNRTHYPSDYCTPWEGVKAGNISLGDSLQGMVLDVIICEGGTEATPFTDENGRTSMRGLTANLVNRLAVVGGFEWRALLVNGPRGAYSDNPYNNSWTACEKPPLEHTPLAASVSLQSGYLPQLPQTS